VNFSWPGLGVTGPGPHAVAVTGDATYTVIASTSCGQSLTATVTIDLEVPPTITLPPVIAEGCVPLEVTMPDSLTTDPVTYLWDFGDGSTGGGAGAVHTYAQAGTYTVSLLVTTPNGCTASATNTGVVIGHGEPTTDFSASPWSTTFDTPEIQFTADQGAGITAYAWTFGDGATGAGITPSHTYDDIGTFQVVLTVTDANGCTGDATHDVEILPVYDITIPNAFTPNPNGGNGGSYDPTDLGNDVFYPFVKFVKEYRMLIYNRWGELVFESNDINIGWDGYYRGQLSQQDVYVYKMWIRFVDDKEVEKRGDLTLFR
jgi:gliding motility-associated-like protein